MPEYDDHRNNDGEIKDNKPIIIAGRHASPDCVANDGRCCNCKRSLVPGRRDYNV
jgi:hypothetical protein